MGFMLTRDTSSFLKETTWFLVWTLVKCYKMVNVKGSAFIRGTIITVTYWIGSLNAERYVYTRRLCRTGTSGLCLILEVKTFLSPLWKAAADESYRHNDPSVWSLWSPTERRKSASASAQSLIGRMRVDFCLLSVLIWCSVTVVNSENPVWCWKVYKSWHTIQQYQHNTACVSPLDIPRCVTFSSSWSLHWGRRAAYNHLSAPLCRWTDV